MTWGTVDLKYFAEEATGEASGHKQGHRLEKLETLAGHKTRSKSGMVGGPLWERKACRARTLMGDWNRGELGGMLQLDTELKRGRKARGREEGRKGEKQSKMAV